MSSDFSTDVSAANTCAVHVSVGGVFGCVRSSDTVSLYWCHYVATCETVEGWGGGGVSFCCLKFSLHVAICAALGGGGGYGGGGVLAHFVALSSV